MSKCRNKSILNSEEGPPTILHVIREILIVVKQSSVTETPQLAWSNETCVELRKARFDETNILTGASL